MFEKIKIGLKILKSWSNDVENYGTNKMIVKITSEVVYLYIDLDSISLAQSVQPLHVN